MKRIALGHKLRHYAAELRLCAAIGANPASCLGLAAETWRFHLANGLGGPRPHGKARRYQVRVSGQPSELWLRPLSGDYFVLHEVFLGDCYFVPEAWRGSGRCVVDLGANIGLTTLYLQRFFPQAHFICVEPEPGNAELLRRNTAALGTRAQVIEAAVSNKPGEATFDNTRPSWGGQLREAAGAGHPVRCMTMEEILARAPDGVIDLLKVDIEGAEARLFADPCPWLRRVATIVIELHAPYSLAQFEATMERHGFAVYHPDSTSSHRQLFALNTRMHQQIA